MNTKILNNLTIEDKILMNLFVDCVHGINDTYGNAYLTEPYGEDVSRWFSTFALRESNSIPSLIQEIFKIKEFDSYDRSCFFKENLDEFLIRYKISIKNKEYIKEILASLAKQEIYEYQSKYRTL